MWRTLKPFLVFASIIMLLAIAYHLPAQLREYNVQRKGVVVRMKIVMFPKDCESFRGSDKIYMEVRYKDKFFRKEINAHYCRAHKLGEDVPMKYLAGQGTVLFPDESAVFGLYVMAFFSIASIACILFAIFLKRKSVQSTVSLKEDEVHW